MKTITPENRAWIYKRLTAAFGPKIARDCMNGRIKEDPDYWKEPVKIPRPKSDIENYHPCLIVHGFIRLTKSEFRLRPPAQVARRLPAPIRGNPRATMFAGVRQANLLEESLRESPTCEQAESIGVIETPIAPLVPQAYKAAVCYALKLAQRCRAGARLPRPVGTNRPTIDEVRRCLIVLRGMRVMSLRVDAQAAGWLRSTSNFSALHSLVCP